MSGPDRPFEATHDDLADRRAADRFVRDRALCPYTAKNLWLLDYGAAPELGDGMGDDGRAATEDAPAGSKGAAPPAQRRIYVFDEGFWKHDAFWIFEGVRTEIVDHMRRFSVLHRSDWYVNRAVADVRRAAAESERVQPDDLWDLRGTRGRLCQSAMARLGQWRAIVQAERPASLESRGLLPRELGPDHVILRECLAADTAEDLVAAAFLLSPYVIASRRAIDDLLLLSGEKALRAHLAQVAADPFVVACTKRAIVDYLSRILPPRHPEPRVGADETLHV